jgi:hypothetical protein
MAMKVFHMIDEDEDEDETPRAPKAEPENDEIDDDVSSYTCDNLNKGVSQSSGATVADAAGDGPLLGVAPLSGGGRGGLKPTCTLIRVSTYASSLNQTTIR